MVLLRGAERGPGPGLPLPHREHAAGTLEQSLRSHLTPVLDETSGIFPVFSMVSHAFFSPPHVFSMTFL